MSLYDPSYHLYPLCGCTQRPRQVAANGCRWSASFTISGHGETDELVAAGAAIEKSGYLAGWFELMRATREAQAVVKHRWEHERQMQARMIPIYEVHLAQVATATRLRSLIQPAAQIARPDPFPVEIRPMGKWSGWAQHPDDAPDFRAGDRPAANLFFRCGRQQIPSVYLRRMRTTSCWNQRRPRQVYRPLVSDAAQFATQLFAVERGYDACI